METLQAGRKIGCYELIKILGEGGMGEVWLAHDAPADRSVALKFIKPHLLMNPEMRLRFANEARTLGKLEQDRIVTLYTVVEEGEHLAFVLRYIEGHSLADRIATRSPLPESFVLSLSRNILPALGEAHQRGIIHRDIKPQNILIDLRDRSFLSDFGIAVTDFLERATIGAMVIGTPHYMSPEQIQTPLDVTIPKGGERTDIYSYGIVLYEMLTKQVPFGQNLGSEANFTIQQAHCYEAPARPRTINSAISPAMEEVVLHCLEKNPDDRPQTCAALLDEIEAAVAAGTATVLTTGNGRETKIEHVPPLLDPRTSVRKHLPTQTQPRPNFESSAKRSAGQRNLPLAIVVGLLVVVGLGLAFYAFSGKPKPASTQAAKPPVSTETAPLNPQSRPTSPVETTPARSTTPAEKSKGTGSTPLPPDHGLPGSTQTASISHLPKTGSSVTQEEMLYNEAEVTWKGGQYCAAQDTVAKAIALQVDAGKNPDARYIRRRDKYKQDCATSQ